jgi:hypothetical protein
VENYNNQLSDKEVFSPVMNNEIVVKKPGILGRLKVVFNFKNKLDNGMSNVDTVYIKYHDLCKRKFV